MVDVNIVLFDKTGTITVGKREMTDFVNISEIDNVNFIEFLYLSSFSDVTHEGKSITRFTEHHEDYKEIIIDEVQYESIPFSSSEPISGCNYNGIEVRKGIMKQIQKFHDHGLHTVVVTGDNAITAKYVVQKIGIEEFYAESTPEKKLELVRAFQQQGYVVAMCGDGINDSLALAQADVGFTFTDDELYEDTMVTGNVISKKHDLSNLLELKNICKKMTVKRGVLTVFSLTSDIVKYFVIVPALFATAFPPLNVLNFMNFQSLDSVILASIMFNALIIPALMPFIFRDFNKPKSQYSLWKGMFLYGISGIISPFIFIKLIEILIYNLGLV